MLSLLGDAFFTQKSETCRDAGVYVEADATFMRGPRVLGMARAPDSSYEVESAYEGLQRIARVSQGEG